MHGKEIALQAQAQAQAHTHTRSITDIYSVGQDKTRMNFKNRQDTIYDLEAEINTSDLETPRYQKEFQFQIQGIPIDIILSNTYEAGHLSFGMRLGIGAIGGVTQLDTDWKCCIFDQALESQPIEFTWTQEFTRPVVRQECAADKWTRWKMNKKAFVIDDIVRLADPQGRLKIHWFANKFQSSPDNSVLLRLIFDQLFRTADQNVILNQTNALRDALEALTRIRRQNSELELQSRKLVAQAKVDEQTIRGLKEASNVLTSKKRKVDESETASSNTSCTAPRTAAQLESILFAMQENFIESMKPEELRKVSDTISKFQNSVSQVLAAGKTCLICTDEIKESTCLVSCGHTGLCLLCATKLVAQHEPGEAECPECRCKIQKVIRTF